MDMDMSTAACGWPNPPVPRLDFTFLFLPFDVRFRCKRRLSLCWVKYFGIVELPVFQTCLNYEHCFFTAQQLNIHSQEMSLKNGKNIRYVNKLGLKKVPCCGCGGGPGIRKGSSLACSEKIMMAVVIDSDTC